MAIDACAQVHMVIQLEEPGQYIIHLAEYDIEMIPTGKTREIKVQATKSTIDSWSQWISQAEAPVNTPVKVMWRGMPGRGNPVTWEVIEIAYQAEEK